jgi:hypothetical protein
MSGALSITPYSTNQPANTFLLQTQGLVQGAAYDDPSARMELAGGVLASTETVVMWGGVPLTELINVPSQAGAGADGLGPSVKRATTQANTTGWSVYNQAMSMVITPGATAPVSGVGNYVGFFRYGSNIRIAVQLDPALVAALVASDVAINAESLYWDVTNYRVTLVTTGGNWALPTATRLLSVNTNSKVITTGTAGVAPWSWTSGDAGIILI